MLHTLKKGSQVSTIRSPDRRSPYHSPLLYEKEAVSVPSTLTNIPCALRDRVLMLRSEIIRTLDTMDVKAFYIAGWNLIKVYQ
jgi:hypothetical protein